MPRTAKSNGSKTDSTTHLGFATKLWLAADKLRNNMDAAEPSGTRQTTAGSPQGERGGANQYRGILQPVRQICRTKRDVDSSPLSAKIENN